METPQTDNRSRWIAAIIKARSCDAYFARRVFHDEVIPVVRMFPPELLDEPAPEADLEFFGDAAPKFKRIRLWDLVVTALVRSDFAVRIYYGNIAFSRTHLSAPKRFAIAKFIAAKTDSGSWRLDDAARSSGVRSVEQPFTPVVAARDCRASSPSAAHATKRNEEKV